ECTATSIRVLLGAIVVFRSAKERSFAERKTTLPVLHFRATRYCPTWTIQHSPKRSPTMPKAGEKKVLVNGMWTCPPSDRAAKSFPASASLVTVIDSEKPWKFGFPWHWLSEAITTLLPMRKLACITLFSAPGGTMPGACGSGESE